MSTTSKIGPSAIYGAFDTLNVKPGASAAEIKAAFRKGALRNHPDKTHDPATAGAFQNIVDAHATLEKAGFLNETQPTLPSRHTKDTYSTRDQPRATRPAPSTPNRTRAYDDEPPPKPTSKERRRSESTRRNSYDRPPQPANYRPSPSARPPPTSFTYTIPTTPPRSRPSSSHGRPPSRSERPVPREGPVYADNTLPSQRPTMSHRHTDQPAYVTELRVPPNDPSRLQSRFDRIPRPEPLASTRRSLARSYTDSTPVDRPQLGKTKVYQKETYHYSTRSGKKKRVTVETFY